MFPNVRRIYRLLGLILGLVWLGTMVCLAQALSPEPLPLMLLIMLAALLPSLCIHLYIRHHIAQLRGAIDTADHLNEIHIDGELLERDDQLGQLSQSVKDLHLRLRESANTDPLTKLPNRKLFLYLLDNQIFRSRRNHNSMGILFIDLDGFKGVNDNLGHDAGDQLLYQTAQRLSALVRKCDVVARHAGDEFTLLLNGIKHHDDLTRMCGNVVTTLRQPYDYQGRTISISASVGACLMDHTYRGNGLQLIQQADRAMYQAKAQGKNGHHIIDLREVLKPSLVR